MKSKQPASRSGLLALLLTVLNFAAPHAFGQGTTFTYQGVLNDGATPANGVYDLRFRLYDDVTGGVQVATQFVIADLPVTNGLYTVALDFGAVWNGSPRWLEVNVRPGPSTSPYTILAPRQAVTPTPYAVFAGAANAASLSGTVPDARLSANVALRSGGNAFTGQQTVSGAQLIVANDTAQSAIIQGTGNNATPAEIFFDKLATGPQHRSAVGYAPDRGHFTWVNGFDRMVISTNGNVGIGEPSPATPLHVAGTVTATSFSGSFTGNGSGLTGVPFNTNAPSTIRSVGTSGTFGSFNGMIESYYGPGDRFGLAQLPSAATALYTAGSNPLSTIQLGRITGAASFQPQLTVNPAGNVGIGTTTFTNAAVRLEVAGSGIGLQFIPGQLNGFADTNAFTLELPGAKKLGVWDDLVVAGEVTCTAVNITSDRNAKKDFTPVNAREILAKVAALPITEWQYKTQGDARHIGPMAQDFRAAFGVGRDEKHITSVDADGVALAAIQGLHEIVREKDAELGRLKAENESLAARLSAIERLLGQGTNAK